MVVSGESKPDFFFKIILWSNLEDKTLRIPEKFARDFRNDLSSPATLVVPPGKNWTVSLLSEGGELWLGQELGDFFACYSVSFGYFLLFEYLGKSKFGVRIFNLTACEISYPSDRTLSPSNQSDRIPLLSEPMSDFDDDDDAEDANSIPDQDDEDDDDANYTPNGDYDDDDDANYTPDQDDDDDDFDVDCGSLGDDDADDGDDDACDDDGDDVVMLERPNVVSSPVDVLELSSNDEASEDQPCESDSGMRTGLFTDEVKEEFESSVTNRNLQSKRSSIAPSSVIKATNVLFRKVLKPCDFKEPMSLIIPPKIGRKFPQGGSGLVKLEVSDGRTWKVQGDFDRGRLTSLGKGWADFVRDTKLMVDDICQFELITYDDESSIKVSMHRKKP